VVVLYSSNAFHPINEVTLRRAGLVLGWVTACGHLGIYSASQVKSAWPSFRG